MIFVIIKFLAATTEHDPLKNQLHISVRLYKWMLFLMGGLSMSVACVPVEEKVEAAFDISFTNPAIRHVYDLQNRQVRDSLIMMLTNEDPSLRYAAARAFASFQDTTALKALESLLQDPNGKIRMMAAVAIGQLGAPAAVA